MPTNQTIFDQLANDKTTPEFSRQLAKAVNSPLFTDNYQAREAFASQVSQYATLADLPPHLQEVYRRAMASRDEQ